MVLYVYQASFVPPPPPASTEPLSDRARIDTDSEMTKKEEIKPSTSSNLIETTAPTPVRGKTTALKASTDDLFAGDKFQVLLSTAGGGSIKSFTLSDYKSDITDDLSKVERITVKEGDPLPLSLFFKGDNLDIPVNTVFDLNKKSDHEFKYLWSSSSGIEIEKAYKFDPDNYGIDMEITVINNSPQSLNGTLGLNLYEREIETGDYMTFIGQAVKTEEEIIKTSFEDIKSEPSLLEGKISWFAFQNKYFITALIPRNDSRLHISSRRIDSSLIVSSLEFRNIQVPSGQKKVLTCSVYIGPKDLYLLQEMGSGLKEAIDLGWFHSIAEPLLRFLKSIYSYTGNYGYAIILVTLMIKLIFFPLANKSYRSMKEMQKLQPKMTELREKYKDDKERMSREVMELYRKNKVNPLSGCLPMIVQIPVFIALYNVLLNAIELRHAPFHLWIMDMSTKDPYYVTPILMGASMFLQQKMSPAAPDPTQQKVMMMMPVIFTVMFINLPSGLVLYWLVNNILSIAQQYYILKSN